MSKITNDGLTQSGTGCFIAVPMVTVGVKGLTVIHCVHLHFHLCLLEQCVNVEKEQQVQTVFTLAKSDTFLLNLLHLGVNPDVILDNIKETLLFFFQNKEYNVSYHLVVLQCRCF